METTAEKIGKKYTPAQRRLTSNEVFNQDAELMWGNKEMFMRMAMRKNQGKTERREKFYNMVFEYVKEFSERLKKKTWGVWAPITEMKNLQVREILVREIGGLHNKVLFDDDTLNGLIEKGLNNYEYSEIYN